MGIYLALPPMTPYKIRLIKGLSIAIFIKCCHSKEDLGIFMGSEKSRAPKSLSCHFHLTSSDAPCLTKTSVFRDPLKANPCVSRSHLRWQHIQVKLAWVQHFKEYFNKYNYTHVSILIYRNTSTPTWRSQETSCMILLYIFLSLHDRRLRGAPARCSRHGLKTKIFLVENQQAFPRICFEWPRCPRAVVSFISLSFWNRW